MDYYSNIKQILSRNLSKRQIQFKIINNEYQILLEYINSSDIPERFRKDNFDGNK